MARLIDADALLQTIEDNRPMNWTDSDSEIQADIDYKCFTDMVKNQPTAYDVEKVVAELEEYKNWYISHGCNEDLNRGIIGATNHAIEIVKGGGKV